LAHSLPAFGPLLVKMVSQAFRNGTRYIGNDGIGWRNDALGHGWPNLNSNPAWPGCRVYTGSYRASKKKKRREITVAP